MPRRKSTDHGVVPPNGTADGTSKEPVNGATSAESNGTTESPSHGATNGDPTSEGSLIGAAEALRESLRESLNKTGELITALKRHRKQSRLVQSTLSSLKQLQTLDA